MKIDHELTDRVKELREEDMLDMLQLMSDAQNDALLCVAAHGAVTGLNPDLIVAMTAGVKASIQNLADWLVLGCGGSEKLLNDLLEVQVRTLPVMAREGFERAKVEMPWRGVH